MGTRKAPRLANCQPEELDECTCQSVDNIKTVEHEIISKQLSTRAEAIERRAS